MMFCARRRRRPTCASSRWSARSGRWLLSSGEHRLRALLNLSTLTLSRACRHIACAEAVHDALGPPALAKRRLPPHAHAVATRCQVQVSFNVRLSHGGWTVVSPLTGKLHVEAVHQRLGRAMVAAAMRHLPLVCTHWPLVTRSRQAVAARTLFLPAPRSSVQPNRIENRAAIMDGGGCHASSRLCTRSGSRRNDQAAACFFFCRKDEPTDFWASPSACCLSCGAAKGITDRMRYLSSLTTDVRAVDRSTPALTSAVKNGGPQMSDLCPLIHCSKSATPAATHAKLKSYGCENFCGLL